MQFLPKKRVIAVIPLVFIASIFAFYLSDGRNSKNFEVVSAERKTVSKEILISGATEPKNSADLAFEQGGRIQSAYARIGQSVKQGTILASLDTSDLIASLHEAQADLELQEARLSEILKGAKIEEIALYESRLNRAEGVKERAYSDFWNTFRSIYVTSDDALYRVADQLFSSPRSSNPSLTTKLSADQQITIDLNFSRVKIGDSLETWLDSIQDTSLDIREADRIAGDNLRDLVLFFDLLSRAVNNASPVSGLSEATLSEWRASVSATRNSLSAAITSLSSAYEKIESANDDVNIAFSELSLAKSPATGEQIAAQRASVDASRARIERISSQIAKSYIKAPIDGVVTIFDAEIGEIAQPGAKLISLINSNDLVIKAYIPEIDIGDVAIKNKVNVNFDAFPAETFEAEISSIEPEAKLIDGVPNYRATISLIEPDSRLKSGLSADLAIVTSISEDAISIPRFSIVEEDGDTFVRKIINGSPSLTPVKLGIKGSDGSVEVLSGLAEFDKIALPE